MFKEYEETKKHLKEKLGKDFDMQEGEIKGFSPEHPLIKIARFKRKQPKLLN